MDMSLVEYDTSMYLGYVRDTRTVGYRQWLLIIYTRSETLCQTTQLAKG